MGEISMVAFFVPGAIDAAEAERVFEATRKNVGAPDLPARIRALSWHHSGQAMRCEVGGIVPAYYQTGDELVAAIFDNDNHYFICTPSRGVVTGGPIYAEKDVRTSVWYFDT
jgi:hypothetical protein